MFGRTKLQIENERKIEDLGKLVHDLAGAVDDLHRRCADLQQRHDTDTDEIRRLRACCASFEDQRDADAACLDEVRVALASLLARLDPEGAEQSLAEELRLAMNALSNRMDWEAEKLKETATALFEQMRLIQTSDRARGRNHI